MSIQSVLTSAVTTKINFRLMGVSVVGSEFKTVEGKISGGKVEVKRQLTSPEGGHAAVYDPKTRTLKIFSPNPNFPSDSWEGALVVHEAVHIAGHMHKRNVPAVAEEMAAHTAQGMYLILSTGRRPSEVALDAADKAKKLLAICGKQRKDCEDARLSLPETLSAPGAASDGVFSRSLRRNFRTSNARYARLFGRSGPRVVAERPDHGRVRPTTGARWRDGQAARRS